MKRAISRLFGRRRMTLARFQPTRIQPKFSVAAAAVIMLATSASTAGEGSFARDLKVKISVNQVGFTCNAHKYCVVPGNEVQRFCVVQTSDGTSTYRGELAKESCDFGASSVGDFSAVRKPGTYYITAGPFRSFPFRVDNHIYDEALQMIVHYFALQRCGPSTTGYLAPCHVDDGVRLDNGSRQDASGGWHDASDLRKWVGATLQGMVGLQRLGKMPHAASRKSHIVDELRWGNRYFLNMQEPAGYVMSHVGGDALRHSDSNRWTDNVLGPGGGEAQTIPPLPGGSTAPITIVGTSDDRVIQTKPLHRAGQYLFVVAEASTARFLRSEDPDYADGCLEAARRCFDWCSTSGNNSSARDLGIAIGASVELYRATQETKYRDFAVQQAQRLMRLQVQADSDSPIHGQFIASPGRDEPYREISQGCWPLIGLCELVSVAPDHPDAARWREAIARFTQDFLLPMAQRNNYGIVPFGLFVGEDPGGDRRIGQFWYRYFMRPERGWWVGINANLASTGVGLIKASRALSDPRLAAQAQRQLDWILGANPHNASTVEGVGHNHPGRFINGSEFKPATPRLPGAVMNGIGGTHDDQPDLYDGQYNTAEYWTPMVAYTMWLMAELQR